ncbi:DUF503 domain-containing protein [bacterium]|nr:MAG: DUF503 domain-containing protein [bacterium]RKZ23311.1 MAG: DUF503 domain-containing protein [bacterium]RKZ24774.1 MAG: DUF503 domain-containing protein [bacterium]
MIVGVGEIDIHIPGIRSLKEKRRIINEIKNRIKNRFNVSISEVDYHDLWQRALLGIAAVATDGKGVDVVMRSVLSEIERDMRIQVLDYRFEVR